MTQRTSSGSAHRLALSLGAVLTISACAADRQSELGVEWRHESFDSACALSQTLALSADVGRLRPLTDGRYLLIDPLRGTVQHLSESGSILWEAGGIGSGPGEYRLPSDATEVGDSMFAIVDPAQMRISLLDRAGHHLRSIRTTSFAGRRILSLPGQYVLAGLNASAGGEYLLARFDTGGGSMGTTVPAPPLLRTLTPRIDEAVLFRLGGTSIAVANALIPTVWLDRGAGVVAMPLRLPTDVWTQLEASDEQPKTPAEARARVGQASMLTGGGSIDDTTIALGWRQSQDDAAPRYLAIFSLGGAPGTVLDGVPGSVIDLAGSRVWVLLPEPDTSMTVRQYQCNWSHLQSGSDDGA